MTPPLQDRVEKDDDKQQRYDHWRFWCYSLHALLVLLHLVLLGFAAWHHAERRVIIQHDIGTFTVGLSGGLQAFYTLYTALLVFITQRLMLSAIFSRPKKLTQIHDICGAWAGLGAALSTLWQQTKVASSVLSVTLVMVYFACISVLHVTSSTLIQARLFNDTESNMEPVTATWPNASVNLTSLDWSTVTTLAPFLQALYGSTTNGLANNTLYDIPPPDFFNATVRATTVNAQCGVLTNLSAKGSPGNMWSVNASMSDFGLISTSFSYPPLPNEIWFSPTIQCLQPICSNLILYLVSATMEVDDSVGGVSNVYINGSYYTSDVATANISSPVYLVACSLNTTNHNVTLGPSGIQPDGTRGQPSNATWSTFSLSGDLNLTSGISFAMTSANSLPPTQYRPVMYYYTLGAPITAFNAYMDLLLGMPGTMSLEQYTGTPLLLTRDRVESAVSQIAAQFLWLAGELGEVGGGFNRQTDVIPIVPSMLRQWRLNINPLPVVIALCASIILFVLVISVLRRHHAATGFGAGVLEIMWFGSRSQVLRRHFNDVKTPSLDNLRASSMLEAVFWACTEARREENSVYAAVPSYNSETDANPGFMSVSRPESKALQLSDHSQRKLRISSIFCGALLWCYTLHIMLVALHVALLAALVHHPEHSVVILYESSLLTVGLSALLQGVYTFYSAVLVLLMQRLALLRMVSGRRKLTTVHDISGAWTGIGASIYVFWQQHKISSSTYEIVSVGVYLVLMLVLHIVSSSIMQWEVFDDMIPGTIQTNLALADNGVDLNHLEWVEIFPIARALGQDTGLTTHGLLNTTLYDVPQDPSNVAFTSALVNATTLTAQCGLVPNITQTLDGPYGLYEISFWNDANNGTFLQLPLWKDVVQMIMVNSVLPDPGCIACSQTLFYLVTTSINIDEPILDPVIRFNWTYTPSGGDPQNSTTLAYIAACSFSTQTVVAPLDLRTGTLQVNPIISTPNMSWSVWSPGNASNISAGMMTALSQDVRSADLMLSDGKSTAQLSTMDGYIMSLLELNLSSENASFATQSSADPSVTLSPWQLENAISQTASRFLWLAGQVGENGGGFQRSVGESQAMNNIVQWRLHLNAIPVILASIASLLSLVLAIVITGKGPSRRHPPSILGTSVLECLWAEAQSEKLHSRLVSIEEPHIDNLRAACMFDICLGDIAQSSNAEANLQLIPELVDE